MDRLLFFCYYAIVIIVSYFLYLNVGFEFRKQLLCFTLILALVALLPFVFKKEPVPLIKGQYFRPVFIFILGFIVVHFQIYVDLMLDNVDINDLNRLMSAGAINKSALISVAGLASFLSGYIYYIPSVDIFSKKMRNDLRSKNSIKLLIIIWFFLLVLILIFFRQYYFLSRYGKNIEGTSQSYLILLFEVVFFAIVSIGSYNAYVNKINKFSNYIKSFGVLFVVTCFVYFLLILLSGDRGPIIYMTLAIFFSYILVTKKKYSLYRIVLFFYIGAILVTIMGVARSLDKELSYSDRFTIASKEFESQSISPYTNELAGSVRTLEYAVEYVPENHPYLYGLFKVKEIVSIIPYISHLSRIFFDNQFKYKGTASFLTWIEQGNNPSSGAGATVVADLYIDFGWLGVVLGLFMFGLLFRKLDYILFCKDLSQVSMFSSILGIVLFSMAVYIPRSTLLLQLKLIVWVWVVVYVYKLIIFYARR